MITNSDLVGSDVYAMVWLFVTKITKGI